MIFVSQGVVRFDKLVLSQPSSLGPLAYRGNTAKHCGIYSDLALCTMADLFKDGEELPAVEKLGPAPPPLPRPEDYVEPEKPDLNCDCCGLGFNACDKGSKVCMCKLCKKRVESTSAVIPQTAQLSNYTIHQK